MLKNVIYHFCALYTIQTTIPSDKIDTSYDLMYLIGMMDNNRKGFIYPDLNKETQYSIQCRLLKR